MALSKKYYRVFAEIFRTSDTKDEVERKMVAYFAVDNPRFDRERFNAAASGRKLQRMS